MKIIYKVLFVFLLVVVVFFLDTNKSISQHLYDVKPMTGYVLNPEWEGIYICYDEFKIRFKNIGTMTVNHIKFRLKIWKKNKKEDVVYSHKHTVDIYLEPQDILTCEEFDLVEKICANGSFWAFYSFHAEILKVW